MDAEGDTEAGVALVLLVVPEGVVVLIVIGLVVCSSGEDFKWTFTEVDDFGFDVVVVVGYAFVWGYAVVISDVFVVVAVVVVVVLGFRVVVTCRTVVVSSALVS